MSSYSGLFVAFEGIDGSGKSTQISLVTKKLQELGYDVHPTSEPSSGKLGPILREYLSDASSLPEVDALLFAADRVEHYFTEVLPKLKEGYIVLTDRYKTSSLIYQGLGKLPDEWILEINNRVEDPDLTIYFDIDAEIALERVSDDRDHLEKFETLEVLENLLDRYDSIEIPNKHAVDANTSITSITENIVTVIRQKMDASANLDD